jgi:hypothetical protein
LEKFILGVNMYESFEFISILSSLLSIVLAIVGLYLVCKNWIVWKKTSLDIIKARAFLNKEFLERNWFLVVVAGGLIALRRVYRFIELSRDPTINNPMEVLFDIVGFVVIFLLVLMAYQWYTIIQNTK